MNKKELEKVYKQSLEDWPMFPKKAVNQYKRMRCDFDKYMGAVEKDAFFYGYACAIRDMRGLK